MNPFALLRRATKLPGPKPGLTYAYRHLIDLETTEVELANALPGFDPTNAGYLIVKNTGPGIIHLALSAATIVVVADPLETGVLGWPLQVGEMEHFEHDGIPKLWAMSPTEAALWVRVGS